MLTNMLGSGGLGGMAVGAFVRGGLALRDGCIALAVTVVGSLFAVGDASYTALEAIRTAAGLGLSAPETTLRQLLLAALVVGCLQTATVVALLSLLVRTAWAAGGRVLRILATSKPAAVTEVGHAG